MDIGGGSRFRVPGFAFEELGFQVLDCFGFVRGFAASREIRGPESTVFLASGFELLT
jgi:hypothetical protein